MAWRTSVFKDAVRGAQIRKWRGQGPMSVAVDARSVNSLRLRRLRGYSRPWPGFRRLHIMRTFKEQAAAARAAGLKRFIADRPCRHGHLERRTDRQGTCIGCNYLRYRPVARSPVNATSTAAE